MRYRRAIHTGLPHIASVALAFFLGRDHTSAWFPWLVGCFGLTLLVFGQISVIRRRLELLHDAWAELDGIDHCRELDELEEPSGYEAINEQDERAPLHWERDAEEVST